MTRRKNRQADEEEQAYRWWIQVIAVPLAVSLIAGGSAIWAAKPDHEPELGCSA